MLARIINKVLQRIERKKILKEGGEKESCLLRQKAKKEHNIDVGMYSYGGIFSASFNLGGEVKCGRYCSIAPNVKFLAGNHPYNRVSMSPYFYLKSWGLNITKNSELSYGKLEIGHDVWIGDNVIILSNVRKIGNGAVIGAGSIVTHDVEPYSIVGGNPARMIKMRFNEEEIESIEKSRWWELTPKELEKVISLMDQPIAFGVAVCNMREKYENDK